MHLRRYLEEAGLTQAEFGQRLVPPASQAKVSKWLEGKARVSLADALQVCRLCDGKVTFEELAAMYRSSEGGDAEVEDPNGSHAVTVGVAMRAANPNASGAFV